ncbi:hypothetical protein UFOVP1244_70 [uncultured Caudovirales phage]|uniref:Uncharacterized protein n=1 Tax=uncultured Caudovirales phage TaxID=2100421 RepID=A0A6J5RAD1_9CAUD|nr:hypothetical protein UFOVP1244_70 [uncultured Caudovirales phage]
MSIPRYIASGTGANIAAASASLAPTFPAGIASSDLAILLMYVKNDSTATLTTSNTFAWTDIQSSTLIGTSDKIMARYHICNGTESSASVEVKSTGAAGRRAAIIYQFRGDTNQWNFEDVSFQSNASSITHADLGISTSGNERLILNMWGWSSTQQLSVSLSAETGGSWTNANKYDSGQNPALELQICSLTTSGSISNGSVNLVSGANVAGIIGVALWVISNFSPSGETAPAAFGGNTIICPLGYNPT